MLPVHGGTPDAPTTPFTQALLSSWTQVEWLPALAMLATAVWYLLAVRVLHRRGDRWPVGRTVSFIVGGLGTLTLATEGPLAAYDTTLISVHMVQHMLISMVAPIFFALGAPVTLALRTFARPLHRALMWLLHSTFMRVLAFPIVSGAIAVANPWALYFSGFYELTLRNVWWHDFNHLHFLVVGCLWTFALIGIDPMPRVGHAMRMLAVFLTMPFHAFLGLTIMGQHQLIAADWYLDQRRTWGATPAADQQLAGGILWAAGELVSILIFIALMVQWSRASEREARRVDRQLDREDAIRAAAAAPHAGE
ncbi:MAG: cytochrome c oxidase assembly protein [Candidatus Nanopelagicales bacterium]